MKNYIFLQARMGSSRLPGKTLKNIKNMPLLYYVVERLKFVKGCDLVVLTSEEKQDNEIVNWCKNNNIYFFRGSEENVLKRYYDAALYFQADNIIRATADNPLVEPFFASDLLLKHIEYKVDYSSNKSEICSNLPNGLGIEIFTFDSLEKSFKNSFKDNHFEHVNEYILENRDKFKIYKDVNVGGFIDKSYIRLTVDTIEDFINMEKIISNKDFKIDINYIDLLRIVNETIY